MWLLKVKFCAERELIGKIMAFTAKNVINYTLQV